MNTAMNTGTGGGQSKGYGTNYSTGAGSSGAYGLGSYQSQSRGGICSDATSRTFLALAGGAGAGALLMYLLDPEQGQERRQYSTKLASRALSNTASALGSAWEHTRDMASHVGEATAAGASAFRHKLSDSADYVSDTRIGRSASRFRGEASDRFGYLMRGKRSTGFLDSGFGEAMAAVGCLAVGFTTMYFFDPRNGAGRRSVCRDKFLSGFNRMATSLERLGRHLYNQATGVAYEARSRMSREEVDDRVIVDRVRSGIGRCVSNVGAVQVQSRNGRVTLGGHVLASEADSLLKCAWSVRGVKEIINQLQIRSHDGPQTSSAVPTSMASTRPTGMASGMTSAIGAGQGGDCPPSAAL